MSISIATKPIHFSLRFCESRSTTNARGTSLRLFSSAFQVRTHRYRNGFEHVCYTPRFLKKKHFQEEEFIFAICFMQANFLFSPELVLRRDSQKVYRCAHWVYTFFFQGNESTAPPPNPNQQTTQQTQQQTAQQQKQQRRESTGSSTEVKDASDENGEKADPKTPRGGKFFFFSLLEIFFFMTVFR